MSVLCETLTALSLTLGVFCQPAEDRKALVLPIDDRGVWEIKPPAPVEKATIPPFPAIIIEAAPAPLPTPVPAPKPRAVVEPKPSVLNAYRAALEVSLLQGDRGPVDINTVIGLKTEAPASIARLTPPPLGALDLVPPNSKDHYEGTGKNSGLPVDNARIFAADRYITGIVETGYNSQVSGGSIIIQVSRNVYGYHSRNVLIPKGSRMICGSGKKLKQGNTRPTFTCSRILMGGYRSEIIKLAAKTSDVQGHLGISGKVDNRFAEKYGTAFILAGISTAVRVATAAASSNTQNSPLGNVADKGSEELSKKLGEISASVIEQMVNLSPIVTIAQGKRVVIRPGEDWYITKLGARL